MTSKKDEDHDKFSPPETSAGDAAQQVVRAAVSAIPVVGGPVSELLNALVTPVLDKRRRQWMEEVADALRKLEGEHRLKIDDLQDNEQFVDSVLQATQVALRTSQQEKRDALRNALLNSVLPDAPPASLQHMFMNWIEDFTSWHIRILKLMDSPVTNTKALGKVPLNAPMGALAHVLENAYPQLRGNRSFYDQVWSDLWARGLVNTQELSGMMTGHGLNEQRTSGVGRQFISFISEPSAA